MSITIRPGLRSAALTKGLKGKTRGAESLRGAKRFSYSEYAFGSHHEAQLITQEISLENVCSDRRIVSPFCYDIIHG